MIFDHMEEIEKLITMVSKSEISELTIDHEDIQIIIRKDLSQKCMTFSEQRIQKEPYLEKDIKSQQEIQRKFPMDLPYGMPQPPFPMPYNAPVQPLFGGIPPMSYGMPQPPFGMPAMPQVQVPQGYTAYSTISNNTSINEDLKNSVPINSSMDERKKNERDFDGNKVKAPLVGTFYAASSPDKEPFVKKGDMVKKGQVLGVIEAMKLMNEIECEYDGVVVDILVQNGDMVEYGQPLFIIK